ncbi:MAG: LemA family protein [Candidatus Thorarchaeota archaeon]|nr:MAG: LemA family protein [Candidatus Thorarchaeota archaeon]
MAQRNVLCLVLVGLVIVGGGIGVSIILTYNNLVTLKVDVENKWNAIAVQYERKIDLIPQLVTTVENYTEFEQETLALITSLRTQWLNLNGSPSEQANVSSQLNLALNTLFVAIQENYPTLYASTLYIGLFDEITGTENRITQAKLDYNDAVAAYNTGIATFPGNLVAGIFGLTPLQFYGSS